MEKISTIPFWSAALLSTLVLAACASDPETIPPFYGLTSDAGRSASNGGSAGGSIGGTTTSTGGTSAPGSGGTSAASATGGSGFGGGGTMAGAGGTLGGGGSGVGASAGAGGATQGGAAGAGTGPGGRGAAGFGSSGRTATGGQGGATAGGAGRAGGSAAGNGGSAGSGMSLFAPVGALVQTTCADADCHGGKERPSLLNTNPATLYNTLINTAVRQCGSDHLAKANDPANSALLELVQHQCGAFVMPEECMANPCIDADAIATITAWIQAGAPAP